MFNHSRIDNTQLVQGCVDPYGYQIPTLHLATIAEQVVGHLEMSYASDGRKSIETESLSTSLRKATAEFALQFKKEATLDPSRAHTP